MWSPAADHAAVRELQADLERLPLRQEVLAHDFGVSVVIRAVILRVESPEAMRGRIASVNFVFILIGTMDLNLPQVLCMGFAGTIGQFAHGKKDWHPVQLAFNIGGES